MIYLNTDVEKFAEENHIELSEYKCHWGCDNFMEPKAVRTKHSQGVEWACDCGCFTYIGRPHDIEFWDNII